MRRRCAGEPRAGQAGNKIGSVVTRDFRVRGTERLRVMEASVFPASVGANPMQTIYTFARIVAQRLRGER